MALCFYSAVGSSNRIIFLRDLALDTIFMSISKLLFSIHMLVNSVWLMTNERASIPRLSKKGTIVTDDLMQAKSMTAHSSLFFENIPMKL